MSKLIVPNTAGVPRPRPIRIVASGTVFLTHVLALPAHPDEGSVSRAKAVSRERGGSATNVLAVLGQFAGVDAMLVAPLAGNSEGAMLMRELKREGINTHYCKVWEGSNVPTAWVLESEGSGVKTVINHNPLPDITHEEFIGLLGPLLVPENYEFLNQGQTSGTSTGNASGRPHSAGNSPGAQQSPAPFEWLHFEGRSIKTTLSNIVGIDGLARERKWRSHCVFSLDASKVRQGVEALMPHADVIFFSKQYALSQNAAFTTPRPFLLALASSGRVPPHALLIAYWGSGGAALLSVPTREYLQSSGWVDDEPPVSMRPLSTISNGAATDLHAAVGSVRSGSGFWAAGHRSGSGTSSSAYTAFSGAQLSSAHDSYGFTSSGCGEFGGVVGGVNSSQEGHGRERNGDDEADRDSQGTEVGGTKASGRERQKAKDPRDEIAAQDAFVAGMIFSLGQRLLPGAPYTPSEGPRAQDSRKNDVDLDRGRWKLDDCLRFASELAGRRARRKDASGLAEEMRRAGWLE